MQASNQHFSGKRELLLANPKLRLTTNKHFSFCTLYPKFSILRIPLHKLNLIKLTMSLRYPLAPSVQFMSPKTQHACR